MVSTPATNDAPVPTSVTHKEPRTQLEAFDEKVKPDRVRSRERAVSRAFKGIVTAGIGWVVTFIETPIGEGIFGASRLVQEVWTIAGRSLLWLGFLVAAGAIIQHLRRFGGRRGVWAGVSFAVAGACGLLAVAEQIEAYWLDTHFLRGLDILGLAGVGVFGVLGSVLLKHGAGRQRDSEA